MESLIRQIARTFEDGQENDKSEPLAKALKEMVFSGLNRGGFFKNCSCLPAFETGRGRDLFACFLNSGAEDAFRIDDFIPCVRDELKAMGVDSQPVKTESGFEVEAVPEAGEEPVRVHIIVFSRKLKDAKVKISYVHSPLAYELRSADEIPESVRSDLENKLKALMKAEKPAGKKAPKKARSEKKRPEEPKETWVQPSLFDF